MTPSKKTMQFKVFNLGLIDFKEAEQLQKRIFLEVKNGFLESGLILCQHYPVFTLGRSGSKKNILASEEELKIRGIQVYQVERGGDITYHGPGQLTVYPMFNLSKLGKDINLFLRFLEDTVIGLLEDFGIKAVRYTGLTGVWVNRQKIASIGIAIKNWITFHGLSINIKKNDLANFHLIRPCGLDIEMTSLETLLGTDIEINTLEGNLIHKFREVFSAKVKGLPSVRVLALPPGVSYASVS